MARYEVFVHAALLETIPKTGSQRRRILDFIYGLRERPDTLGDFTDQDRSLRTRQIKIVDDYAITYWVDSPVKAVMVIDVQPADA